MSLETCVSNLKSVALEVRFGVISIYRPTVELTSLLC